MAREIKFRGKTKDTNIWVFGYLDNSDKKAPCIWFQDNEGHSDWNDINITTAGQYTGIRDKNGKEIYEGDILKRHNKSSHTKEEYWYPIYKVFYKSFEYSLEHIGGGKPSEAWYLALTNWGEMEIIGNIYDNPELLKPLTSTETDLLTQQQLS